MSAITFSAGGAKVCDPYPVDSQMVELSLLLPAWQARELEKEADERGLTAGQMLRRMLRDFMGQLHREEEAHDPWE